MRSFSHPLLLAILALSLFFSGCDTGGDDITLNDTASPTVDSVSPGPGETTTGDQVIMVTFSEVMDNDTLTANGTEGPCTGSWQVSRDDFTTCMGFNGTVVDHKEGKIGLTPDPALPLGTYRLRLTTAITDWSGNAMAADYEMTRGFIVSSGLAVIHFAPTPGTTNVNPDVTFEITFDRGMDTNSLTLPIDGYCDGFFLVSHNNLGMCHPMNIPPSFNSDQSGMTISLDFPLADNAHYQVEIGHMAMAQDGTQMVSPYTSDFYTMKTWPGTIQYGGSGNEKAAAFFANGVLHVMGETTVSFDGLTYNGGVTDFVALRYGLDGTKYDSFMRGGAGNDIFNSGHANDQNGDFFMVGNTNGSFDTEGFVGGPADGVIIRHDTNGTHQWTRFVGTAANDQLFGVTTDGNGNIYAIGFTDGNLAGSLGLQDVIILKYDSTGTPLSTFQLGTSGNEKGYTVFAPGNGDILIAGTTMGLWGTSSFGGNDSFFARVDSGGTVQGVMQWGGPGLDEINKIAPGHNGELYLVGITNSATYNGQANNGAQDVFVTKINSDGTEGWTILIGGGGNESTFPGMGAEVGEDGALYVGGTTASTGGFDGQTYNGGPNDCFLTKIDETGTTQWTRIYGANGDDICTNVTTDYFGRIYLSGNTSSTLGGGYYGGVDFFIAKYLSDGTLE